MAEIKPGETVELRPGGAHGMLVDLRPVCKRLLRSDLSSLHQRIRSQGSTLAKMEIRASRS